MSVVVPVSAVGGVRSRSSWASSCWGDRPSALAWAGIVVAVPALWLVARTRGPATADGVPDALVASVGIAVRYLALAAVALTCYLLATRQQLVTVAVVLSSLYPAIPVLAGITLSRERLTGTQVSDSFPPVPRSVCSWSGCRVADQRNVQNVART